jgi:hypothetical protein
VNEFGTQQFPGNYGGGFSPPPHRPQSPRQGEGSSRPFLVLLLVIACVVLGALLNWGIRERLQRASLSVRNERLENAYVVVLAKRSDLANFLTDPRTRLYRLHGSGPAFGQSATVAWQEETHSGVLIADRIAPPADLQLYVLWHMDAKDQTDSAGAFRPDPAGTYYDFHLVGSAQGTSGFRVSLESDANPHKHGPIVFETN